MHSLAIYFKAPAGRLLLLLDTMTLLQKLFGQFQRLKTSSSENSQLMQTYARLPVSFVRGRTTESTWTPWEESPFAFWAIAIQLSAKRYRNKPAL